MSQKDHWKHYLGIELFPPLLAAIPMLVLQLTDAPSLQYMSTYVETRGVMMVAFNSHDVVEVRSRLPFLDVRGWFYQKNRH